MRNILVVPYVICICRSAEAKTGKNLGINATNKVQISSFEAYFYFAQSGIAGTDM
jgi:hypothetical protein